MRPALSFGDDIVVKLSCIPSDKTSEQDLFHTLDDTKEQVACHQAEEWKGGNTTQGKPLFVKKGSLFDRPSLRTAAMTMLLNLKYELRGCVFAPPS